MRAALILVLLALPLFGQQPRFEAVVSGRLDSGCIVVSPSVPALNWVNPDVTVAPQDSIFDLASAPGRPVYAATNGQIFIIQPDGTRTLFFSNAGNITVASTGRVFVRTVAGLLVISATGALETTHALPGATGMIAVAHDHCTIYYQKSGAIGRINGCTGAVLPDFAPLPLLFTDFYPLPNGNVLVATETNVVLHSESGMVIRNAATDAEPDDDFHFEQVVASPDGQVLYLSWMDGCLRNSELITVSMQSGAQLSRRTLESINRANALVIGSASAPAVPTASDTVLLMLAIVLAFGGAFILKR